jgi:hypothetical protein
MKPRCMFTRSQKLPFGISSRKFSWFKCLSLIYFCRGWFIIDLVSIIPFDILGMVMNSESVSQLKILRIIRLLRLIKLLRILRSARIFKRIQTSLGLSFSSFSLLKLLNIVVFVVHWVRAFSCFTWGLISLLDCLFMEPWAVVGRCTCELDHRARTGFFTWRIICGMPRVLSSGLFLLFVVRGA